MPLDGDQNWSQADVVTEQEILSQLSSQFTVQVLEGQGANPARSYRVDGEKVGIISTISNSFCGECDRLRLNAQGEFYNCLFAKQGLNLKLDIQQLTQLKMVCLEIMSSPIAQAQRSNNVWTSGY
jgi:GTP 3',8-cyclase